MDTSHTTKGLGRMRREISKSRPSHAEMKSKKKKRLLQAFAPAASLDIVLPLHQGLSPAAASGFMPLSKPSSTLPETGRVKASPGPVKQSFAASVEHWRQASWATSRLGSSAGWAGSRPLPAGWVGYAFAVKRHLNRPKHCRCSCKSTGANSTRQGDFSLVWPSYPPWPWARSCQCPVPGPRAPA